MDAFTDMNPKEYEETLINVSNEFSGCQGYIDVIVRADKLIKKGKYPTIIILHWLKHEFKAAQAWDGVY